MKDYFVDLHIHIGQSESGERVKISSSRDLTFHRIIEEASDRKGIDMIGIIDSHSPPVQEDIENLIAKDVLCPLKGGGLRFGNTTVVLGVELEIKDPGYGPAHLLVFMPDLERMKKFSVWLSFHVKNKVLSSQRVHCHAQKIVDCAVSLEGIVIPAHVFSPFKSVYGSASDRMSDLFDLSMIAGVELGLSADTNMADHIEELRSFSFVTNSDAHSLSKIAREYNRVKMEEPTFSELVKALKRKEGRMIAANYGLNPYLGKYHATFCNGCGSQFDLNHLSSNLSCPVCGSYHWTKGVSDRISELSTSAKPQHPPFRPPYVYQIPLEFIPGVGKKTLNKLIAHFGSEMAILHKATKQDLVDIVSEPIAEAVLKAREGKLDIHKGGGGIYGKVMS